MLVFRDVIFLCVCGRHVVNKGIFDSKGPLIRGLLVTFIHLRSVSEFCSEVFKVCLKLSRSFLIFLGGTILKFLECFKKLHWNYFLKVARTFLEFILKFLELFQWQKKSAEKIVALLIFLYPLILREDSYPIHPNDIFRGGCLSHPQKKRDPRKRVGPRRFLA